uniref:EamA domain-containing protein n=1 Tax=Alexandrium catenella TaxID=2925 RepID=A0A7S1RJW0_ALECA
MACLGEGVKTFILVAAMLLLGSYNTLCTKLQFQTCAPSTDPAALGARGHQGCPVGQQKYNKPWLNNMYMFIGEASLMLAYLATNGQRRARALERAESESNALRPEQGLLEAAPRATPFYIFAVPAFCDVFGTGLATVGMQYMDSAVWQMLRSSIIIFSAILSVCFLKRRLQPFHWVATIIVFVGLVLVGLASMLDVQSSADASAGGGASELLLGLVLVVGAQLVSAFQMVFEEMLLTGRVKTSAKKVVGMEGLWGGFFMVVILTLMSTLPGGDDGHFESTPQGLHMLAHSPMLQMLIPTYMLSIAFYNLSGMMVGKKMSTVVRCLVDSCRTFVVWGMNLFIYYFVSEDFGAAWAPHSWLTLIGFCVLVLGTLLYNGVLPVPAWLLRAEGEEAADAGCQAASFAGGLDDVLAKLDLTVEGLATPVMAGRPDEAA